MKKIRYDKKYWRNKKYPEIRQKALLNPVFIKADKTAAPLRLLDYEKPKKHSENFTETSISVQFFRAIQSKIAGARFYPEAGAERKV